LRIAEAAQRLALLVGGRAQIKLREQDSVLAWKMLENAADRASELPASIAQPKANWRLAPHPSSARFVGRSLGSY